MAQQIIDFGAFPNDPAADPIRAAFQKVQNNFTDLYSTTLTTGVVSLTTGAGLTQNRTTGQVLVSANIASVTVQTQNGLVVGVGSPTGTTATITNSTTPLVFGLSGNISISNLNAANIYGTLRTASQPYVTSLGTLVSLGVTGNVTANNFIGNVTGTISGTVSAPGSNTQILFNNRGNIGAASRITYNGSSLAMTGDITVTSGRVTADNFTARSNVEATYFIGTFLGPASTSATVTGNAQNNITSLGTLTALQIAGNLAGNVITANAVTANLTGDVTGNVVGNLSGLAARAASVTGNDQPNITSLGTLTLLNVQGNASVGNVSATYITGAITSPEQTAITRVGTLVTLGVSGNANIGNITATLVSANTAGLHTGNVTGTVTGNTIGIHTGDVSGNVTGNTAGIHTGNVAGNVVGNLTGTVTGNLIGNVSGNITGNIAVPGSDTQMVFRDGGLAATHVGATYNKSSGVMSVVGNIASGNLTSTGIVFATQAAKVGRVESASRIIAVANVGYSGTTITVTTSAPHGLDATNEIVMASITGTNAPNCSAVVASVPSTVTVATALFTVTYSGTTITVTTTYPHGMITGASVVLSLLTATTNPPNGTWTIDTVPTSTTFTFTATSAPTGTIGGVTRSLVLPGSSTFTYVTTVGTPTGALNFSSAVLTARGTINASGTITGAGFVTSGILTVQGNASVGNITARTLSGNIVSVSGNVEGANLVASGLIRIQGTSPEALAVSGGANISGTTMQDGNVVTSNINVTTKLTTLDLSARGNLDGANLSTTGLLKVDGNATVGNMSTGGLATTGAISVNGGKVIIDITGGIISVGTASVPHVSLPTTTLTGTGDITSITNSGTTVTVTTVNPHGMTVSGATIVVTNTTATTNAPNGTWTVSSVVSSTQFRFIVTNSPTGSIGISGSTSIVIRPLISSAGSASIAGNVSAGNVNTTQIDASGNINASSSWINAQNANISGNAQFGNLGTPGNINAPSGWVNAANANISSITATSISGSLTGNVSGNLSGALVRSNALTVTGTSNFSHVVLPSITNIVIASISSANTTVTVTTTSDHGMAVGGAQITIDGVTGTNPPNGTWTVLTVPTNTTFTFTASVAPVGAQNVSVATLAIRPLMVSNGSAVLNGTISVVGQGAFGDVYANTGTVKALNSNITGTLNSLHVEATGNANFSGSTFKVSASATFGEIPTVGNVTSQGNVQAANLVATNTLTGGNLSTPGQLTVAGTANVSHMTLPSVVLTGTGNITSIAFNSTTIRVTTVNAHGMAVAGATVVVSGASTNTNGTWLVTNIVDINKFEYTAPNQTGTGTISVLPGTAITIKPILTSSGSASIAGTMSAGNVGTTHVDATGNITASSGYLISQNANVTGLASVGNLATGGSLYANSGLIKALNSNVTGTLTSLHLDASGNANFTGSVFKVTANANIGNISDVMHIVSSGDIITASGLVKSGTANIVGLANIGSANISGNSTHGNIQSLGLLNVQGNAIVGNVSTAIISATGTVTAGNLSTTGLASVGNLKFPASTTLGGTVTVTYVGTTITITSTVAHGLSTGNEVVLSGITTNGNNAPNGIYLIATVPATPQVANLASTFTVVASVAPTGTLSGGVVTIRPVIQSAGSGLFDGRIKVGGNAEILGSLSRVTDIFASGNHVLSGNMFAGNISTAGTINNSGNQSVGANLVITALAPSTPSVGNILVTFADQGFTPFNVNQSVTITGVTTTNAYNNTYTVRAANATTVTITSTQTGTANVTNARILGAGNLTIVGSHVVGGGITAGGPLNVTSTNQSNFTGNVSIPHLFLNGNVSGATLISTTLLTAQGNVSGGNLVTQGILKVDGNANVGNITTTSLNGTLVSVSGNVEGANLVASGILKVSGTATVSDTTFTPTTVKPITGISYVGNVITVTSIGHGGTQGTQFTLTGVGTTGTNAPNINTNGNPAWFLISTVPNANTFTFVSVAVPTGTLNTTSASLNFSPYMVSTGSATFGGGLSATGVIQAGVFSGYGNNLQNLPGANVTGYVPNANAANLASQAVISGTVTSSSQPNITAVGQLMRLVVGGDTNAGVQLTITAITAGTPATGQVTITYTQQTAIPYTTGQSITIVGVTGTLTYNGSWTVVSSGLSSTVITCSITGAATLSASSYIYNIAHVNLTGNLNAAYVAGNGSLLAGLAGGNVVGNVGNASLAWNIANGNYSNIVGVGTLNALTVSGTVTLGGATANGVTLNDVDGSHINFSSNQGLTGITTPIPILTKTINIISAVSGSAPYNVRLPVVSLGRSIYLLNDTTSTITILPYDASATIEGATSFTLGPNARLQFLAGKLSKWYVMTGIWG